MLELKKCLILSVAERFCEFVRLVSIHALGFIGQDNIQLVRLYLPKDLTHYEDKANKPR